MDTSAMQSLKSRCKNMRILYIEDDEVTRKYTHSILSEFFDFVDIASDGQSGYDMFVDAEIAIPHLGLTQELNTQRYNLVITDIKMPKMDGIALIAKIRKICKETAIIVTSAHNDAEYLIETIRLGVDGYILKPIELDQLLDSLASTIETILIKEEHRAYTSSLKQTIALQQSALEEQLHTDALTKLPNKNTLDRILEQIQPVEVPSLFLINIDNFKNYNKLYGIDAGNEILVEFAHHLKAIATSLCYDVFRISSNEFVMLRLDTQLDPEKIYEDVTQTLEVLDGIEIKVKELNEKILVNISMGVTFDQENLFSKAFTALDFAKRTGKNFVVYTSNLDETESLANDFYWQDVIADTLDKDNVVPFFQPICNQEGQIIKYEALIRIRTKDKLEQEQYVSPYYFLDIARRTRQYDSLSHRMIEKVLEMMIAHPTVTFSINFSFRDMLNKEIRDLVRSKIIQMQEENRAINLVFEVVESEKVIDYNTIINFLKYIKYDNAPIAIDDFGTGYSNFTHLMELNPGYLKIDGSLVKNLDTDMKSLKLVKGIVSFAKALHVKTIAEYVHKKEIFDILVDIGVDEFQGYFIGEPCLELQCRL
ncbi:two-component system response regulator [Sulfurospirillum oryzae]|uniref:two-component system response regulator n=1 Tax=Sulfurospirillum oryzae TaxID=2976535 RepID=UPI0021E70B47|nr:EAL domain-containing response regulator [Sulfurospirillum oryzae]